MNNTLLISAGIIGASVALVHGVLMQKLMIDPLLNSSYGQQMKVQLRRLLPVLLHFGTLCWFLGGLALVMAPFVFDQTERLVVSITVGGFYIFGALGNFWGTRGRHPGWVMLAVSVVLIFCSHHL